MKLLTEILKEIELERNRWTPIPRDEIEAYSKRIYDLIANAYSGIGGNLKIKSPNNISDEDQECEVIDLDDDRDIEAVTVSRPTPAGNKFVAVGHDGSVEAKKAIVHHQVDQLKTKGFYIEASGRVKDILAHKQVPIVNDEEEVKKALRGKPIEWVGDGSYYRTIGGQRVLKTMFGKPIV